MSELLLDRLGKKPAPKKNKPVEIKINKGQVQVETHIVDKTKETRHRGGRRPRHHSRWPQLTIS